MNEQRLTRANETLQIQNKPKSKKLIWILIGIITGVIIIIAIIFWWFRISPYGSNTYPYIPVPKHTARSTSLPELLGNLVLDANETSVDYSVISRPEILHKID
jgi:flagellar basal body-associated protein FliL